MRRLGAFLMALFIAGVIAGCSDNEIWNYDFQGRWSYEERQQSSNCRMNIAALGSMLISQDGPQIEVQVAPVGFTGGQAFGTCDPTKGTISFSWSNALGGISIMKGAAAAERTITGTAYHTSHDGCFANTTWEATLVTR